MVKGQNLIAIFLAGIMICLLYIAQKPVPSFHYDSPTIQVPETTTVPSSDASVVQLDKNRIAIINTDKKSDKYGKIIIMQYDEQSKQLMQVGTSAFSFDLEFGIPK